VLRPNKENPFVMSEIPTSLYCPCGKPVCLITYTCQDCDPVREIERLRVLNAKLVESLKDLVEECQEHDNEYQHVTRPPRMAKALGILIEMKGEK
jgi:hypothetical protein